MIGPIALNTHLINQGVPPPTVAQFLGFIGLVIILVAVAYFAGIACIKWAQASTE